MTGTNPKGKSALRVILALRNVDNIRAVFANFRLAGFARTQTVGTAMNVVPHISVQPEINPLAILPPDQRIATPAPVARPNAPTAETRETIEIRATSMSFVLEKIMAYDGGYLHGGLND